MVVLRVRYAVKFIQGQGYYVNFYMYNGHADVVGLNDASGNSLATYYHDAFGNIVSQTGSFNNNITYAGYQYDSETGPYYLNSRMYDPVTARFMQEDDPTYGDDSDPLSLNLYTYCSNEPIMYDDPTGHDRSDLVDSAANKIYGGNFVSIYYSGESVTVNSSNNGAHVDIATGATGVTVTNNGAKLASVSKGSYAGVTVNNDKGSITTVSTGTGSISTTNNYAVIGTETTGKNSISTVNDYNQMTTLVAGVGSKVDINRNSGTMDTIDLKDDSIVYCGNSGTVKTVNNTGHDSTFASDNTDNINTLNTGAHSESIVNTTSKISLVGARDATVIYNGKQVDNSNGYNNMSNSTPFIIADTTLTPSLPRIISMPDIELPAPNPWAIGLSVFALLSKDLNPTTGSTDVLTPEQIKQMIMQQAKTGSYTIEFESGKKYHGKGPESRMNQSANEKSNKYNDPVKSKDWTPAQNDKEAFKDEYKRMQTDPNGYKDENNYNKRQSPDKKYTEQDSK